MAERMAQENWRYRRMETIIRDDYRCQKCGAAGGPEGDARLEVHHKTPLSEGGGDELSNLKTLCSTCHRSEHSETCVDEDAPWYCIIKVEKADTSDYPCGWVYSFSCHDEEGTRVLEYCNTGYPENEHRRYHHDGGISVVKFDGLESHKERFFSELDKDPVAVATQR